MLTNEQAAAIATAIVCQQGYGGSLAKVYDIFLNKINEASKEKPKEGGDKCSSK